jgi:hypothetical protein
MTLSSKDSRPARVSVQEPDVDEFDFGEPEIITVEIAPGKYLNLREPSANDLIEIYKINSDTKNKLSDVESTLAVICILHSPGPDGRKLTMRDAKKLRAKQIKALGDAMNQLMGYEEEEQDDNKSDDDEEL